jgi:hypothetical protein
VKFHEVFNESATSKAWENVFQDMHNAGHYRSQSAFYDHYTEMRKFYKQGINEVSKSPEKKGYPDLDATLDTIDLYFRCLLSHLKEGKYKKWWSQELIANTFEHTNIGRVETFSSGIGSGFDTIMNINKKKIKQTWRIG